jgi:CRISPR-associated protein (TIGR03986 family)
MKKYRNPYHFVPVKPGPRSTDLSVKDFGARKLDHRSHDRYVSGTYSGRIICRLTTESPIFVGAHREEPMKERAATVEPFTLDGQPAIPASSLRGLISSLAEAASNSALRVLEDRSYSFRRQMGESLSAIGMIVAGDRAGELKLRPLTLPTLRTTGGSARLPSEFHGLYRVPSLKVYVGDRTTTIRDETAFAYRTFSTESPDYYALPLAPRTWSRPGEISAADVHLHVKRGFLLAQRPMAGRALPEPWTEDARAKGYTPGIMRVLGCWGRGDVPNTKIHEIFIPYPEDVGTWPTFPIADEAVERFEDLADQRTSERGDLPYEPRDTRRDGGEDRRFRLKPGDLVYFQPERRPSGTVIAEISLSSIWRGRVEDSSRRPATAHTFFRQVDPELVPFVRPGREKLTPAELLFGFVEAVEKSAVPRASQALALASRVHFSDARLAVGPGSPYLGEVTLRILSSPKPPSPAFYFKRADGKGDYIAKSKLAPTLHSPQGRKFYLHNPAWRRSPQPWQTSNETEHVDQKSRIRPLREGLTFHFHVDFDNLSPHELGMLAFALRPGRLVNGKDEFEGFRHKIGMGKSLGLGTVRIDVEGVLLVDRLTRYSAEGFFGPRYSSGWVHDDRQKSWPDAYRREAEGATSQSASVDLVALRSSFADSIVPDIRTALRLLGDPASSNGNAEVHVPLVEGGEQQAESETYRWFVVNDRAASGRGQAGRAPQFLEPIVDGDTRLPTLDAWPGAID